MTGERRLDDAIVRCEGEGNGVTGRARVYGHRLIKRQDDGQRWMWVKFFARFHALFFYWLQYVTVCQGRKDLALCQGRRIY